MTRIPLTERLFVWMEVEILSRLTPKNNPGPFFKWLFKAPILYYKLGLGEMLGKRFLLLTTTGRKTGKPHNTPLEYVYSPKEDSYRVSPAGVATQTGTKTSGTTRTSQCRLDGSCSRPLQNLRRTRKPQNIC